MDATGVLSAGQALTSLQSAEAPQTNQQGFEEALGRAEQRFAAQPPGAYANAEPSAPLRTVVDKLSSIDGQAKSLADDAQKAVASGGDFSPGEMVMLSVRAHEFMFHAQLTSNMANRSSDGLQQLFRQQS